MSCLSSPPCPSPHPPAAPSGCAWTLHQHPPRVGAGGRPGASARLAGHRICGSGGRGEHVTFRIGVRIRHQSVRQQCKGQRQCDTLILFIFDPSTPLHTPSFPHLTRSPTPLHTFRCWKTCGGAWRTLRSEPTRSAWQTYGFLESCTTTRCSTACRCLRRYTSSSRLGTSHRR